MIEVNNVNYYAGNKHILKDINLTIEDNEFAAVLGPNGAGKSTLIKIILGLINDYSGTVTINGVNNRKWLTENVIGYLPQREEFDRLFPATVMEICLMGLAGKRGLFRNFTDEDRENARKALDYVNLIDLKDHMIGSLSGGELQRMYIARALVSQSNYLFLDEPEAGVDKQKITQFYSLLKDLNEEGKTIILISHDIGTVMEYSKQVICLNRQLHCHREAQLVNADIIKETYGDVVKLIHKEY
ncbi:MAG: metal ABC transporter ATP-binding protein [candidate division WOR-3 bacterium]|nr:metal ABC transporter ATP-binding protein [candidate division WOR-3 bacterium]